MNSYRIIQGDCLQEMPKLGCGVVDCIIADPPYMINSKSDGSGKLDPWADLMNASLWYSIFLRNARYVLKPDGCLWMFMNWRRLPTLVKASADAGWPTASCMVWDKEWLGPGNYLRSTYELVLLFAGDGFRMKDRSIRDVQLFHPLPASKKIHPAEKPQGLLKLLIYACMNHKGGVVLDPFAGSCSTGCAALGLGHDFIGIEMSEKYAVLGVARLEDLIARCSEEKEERNGDKEHSKA